jgi:hypothetical protein
MPVSPFLGRFWAWRYLEGKLKFLHSMLDHLNVAEPLRALAPGPRFRSACGRHVKGTDPMSSTPMRQVSDLTTHLSKHIMVIHTDPVMLDLERELLTQER